MVYVIDKTSPSAGGSLSVAEPERVGAVFLKVHHRVADGVGFQNIMGLLTNPSPDPVYDVSPRYADERPSPAESWIASSAERFKAIQRSTPIEVERAKLMEPLISEFDTPFGARKRYADYLKRTAGGQTVISGNVTLSNVPGPAEPVYLAGARMLTNYPTPILGSGRFLNITLRRYCQHLNLGITTDPEQLGDVDALGRYLIDALDELMQV